jgi:hypothetical protein
MPEIASHRIPTPIATAPTAAKTSQSYIALDANEHWPIKEVNQALLLSIDGLAIMSEHDPEGSEAILARHVETWMGEIERGTIGPILAEIDALPASGPHKAAPQASSDAQGGTSPDGGANAAERAGVGRAFGAFAFSASR